MAFCDFEILKRSDINREDKHFQSFNSLFATTPILSLFISSFSQHTTMFAECQRTWSLRFRLDQVLTCQKRIVSLSTPSTGVHGASSFDFSASNQQILSRRCLSLAEPGWVASRSRDPAFGRDMKLFGCVSVASVGLHSIQQCWHSYISVALWNRKLQNQIHRSEKTSVHSLKQLFLTFDDLFGCIAKGFPPGRVKPFFIKWQNQKGRKHVADKRKLENKRFATLEFKLLKAVHFIVIFL